MNGPNGSFGFVRRKVAWAVALNFPIFFDRTLWIPPKGGDSDERDFEERQGEAGVEIAKLERDSCNENWFVIVVGSVLILDLSLLPSWIECKMLVIDTLTIFLNLII